MRKNTDTKTYSNKSRFVFAALYLLVATLLIIALVISRLFSFIASAVFNAKIYSLIDRLAYDILYPKGRFNNDVDYFIGAVLRLTFISLLISVFTFTSVSFLVFSEKSLDLANSLYSIHHLAQAIENQVIYSESLEPVTVGKGDDLICIKGKYFLILCSRNTFKETFWDYFYLFFSIFSSLLTIGITCLVLGIYKLLSKLPGSLGKQFKAFGESNIRVRKIIMLVLILTILYVTATFVVFTLYGQPLLDKLLNCEVYRNDNEKLNRHLKSTSDNIIAYVFSIITILALLCNLKLYRANHLDKADRKSVV